MPHITYKILQNVEMLWALFIYMRCLLSPGLLGLFVDMCIRIGFEKMV
jgi:hypothetical protein